MKKYLRHIGIALSVTVLSLSSLLFIGTASVFAAGNNCTWIGGTSGDFNTAGNWSNCGGVVPQNGDSLVFDNTSLTGSATVTDDIAGLSIGSITFQGTNSNGYSFTLTGTDPLTVSGGITDTNSFALSDQVSLDLILSGSQAFNDTAGAGGLIIGNSAFTNTLNVGANTLTLISNVQTSGGGGSITMDSQLSGTGGLVMNGTSSGVYNFQAAASGFSGPVTIDNGQAYVFDPGAFGTGAITIDSGGTMATQFESATPTFSNAITVGGNGFNGTFGALIFNDGCPAPGNSGVCTDTGTDTFGGPITLTADTTVGNTGDTVNFTGAFTCSTFTIGEVSGATGTLNGIPAACDGSSSSSAASSSGASAPKTPDTGFALTKANVYLPLLGCVMIAGGLGLISRRFARTTTK